MTISADLSPAAGRLVIGTVQFGLAYGITNTRGQVTIPLARDILSKARAAGIGWVDTAASYGESESVLGRCLPEFPDISVITKTLGVSSVRVDAEAIDNLRGGVKRSCELLGRPKLDALLLHHGSDLLKLGGPQLADLLTAMKTEAIVGRVGVSVYDAREIDGVLEVFQPDIIQLPMNLFDQSLIRSGHVKMLRDAGIEIHARSAFLQGVLLADISQLPPYFDAFKTHFAKYKSFLRETRLSPLQACLGFMIERSGADRIIVGVTCPQELSEIISALPRGGSAPAMDSLASYDCSLTDPRTWPPASAAEAPTS